VHFQAKFEGKSWGPDSWDRFPYAIGLSRVLWEAGMEVQSWWVHKTVVKYMYTKRGVIKHCGFSNEI